MAVETLLDLICTAPTAGTGVATGDSTWSRLSVQLAVVDGGGKVGMSYIDSAYLGEYAWLDITSDLISLEFNRGGNTGSQGLPRANVGVLNLRLDNATGATPNFYSPWNIANNGYHSGGIDTTTLYRDFKAGALIRVVLHTGTPSSSSSTDADNVLTLTRTNWVPLFTGIVESWNETREFNYAFVDLTVVETLTFLANITTTPIASTGAGDYFVPRVNRLATAASWPYAITKATGIDGNAVNVTMQATTMSDNRLSEVYLTCDSALMTQVSTGREGSIRLGYKLWGEAGSMLFTNKWASTYPLKATYTNYNIAEYDPPLSITNNPDFVINDCSITRVGGTTQTGTNGDSIGRFGTRSYTRSDLICESDLSTEYIINNVLLLAWPGVSEVATYDLIDQTLQPGEISIHDNFVALGQVDLYDYCILDYWYNSDNAVRFAGRVVAYRVTMTPANNKVMLDAKYSVLANSNRPRSYSQAFA